MKTSEMQVSLVDHMGNDLSVVNAARVSFNKESAWEASGEDKLTSKAVLSAQDTKLITYLAKHKHWTPFAHAFASFRIKAPIFVARQLVKHQVGLAWNEVSRRYVDDEPEFWMPKEWRGKPVNAKQGSSGIIDPNQESCNLNVMLNFSITHALNTYTSLLKEGVAPEMSRMVLPQNTMTEWIWSGSVAAFARVCNLRLDSHAQLETYEVAQKIHSSMRTLYPVSWKALMEEV